AATRSDATRATPHPPVGAARQPVERVRCARRVLRFMRRQGSPYDARIAPGVYPAAAPRPRPHTRFRDSLLAARGGGYFKTSYEADLALVDARLRRVPSAALVLALLVLPRFASGFVLGLVSQVAFAAIGALALNVLPGLAGQISLGHAGFLAAGA